VPNNLVEKEINVFNCELEELILGMKRQVLEVLLPFISFMHCFQKMKGHNMLVLMLDPRYKSMRLVIIFLGREVATTLMAYYDE
jgi:hypothetical protein